MAVDRRRALIAGLAALPLAAGCSTRLRAPERGPIEAVIVGSADDTGPNAAAAGGLRTLETQMGIPSRVTSVTLEEAPNALAALARTNPGMIIAVGAALSATTRAIAWRHPEERFTVIDGDPDHLRPNLAIYSARQSESAWLAGAAAGLLSKTAVVGHVGGTRSSGGLAARAAFAAGLAATSANARLLTTFTGSDDDAEAAARAARTQLASHADLLFATLARARAGVTDACRAAGARQIGAGADWVAADPAVFAAAAVADIGELMRAIASDLRDSVWRGDEVRSFGLRHSDIVRLALAESTPATVRTALAGLRADVIAGRIAIPANFTGAEIAA